MYKFREEIFETMEELEEELQYVAEEEYDDFLDEEGTVCICGIDFYPSTILQTCDPVAYRCRMDDYVAITLWDEVEEIEDEEVEDEEA